MPDTTATFMSEAAKENKQCVWQEHILYGYTLFFQDHRC
jgi:hypothetical protein